MSAQRDFIATLFDPIAYLRPYPAFVDLRQELQRNPQPG
jgi:hypothetical protein